MGVFRMEIHIENSMYAKKAMELLRKAIIVPNPYFLHLKICIRLTGRPRSG